MAVIGPDCSRYGPVHARAMALIASDRAAADLERYLLFFKGAGFDRLADRRCPGEFTSQDFLAVRRLNVNVLRSARLALLGDAKPDVLRFLAEIPADLDIWEIKPDDYDSRLGRCSPAWQLWRLLFDLQVGARSSGRGVTAGKLLHAKRPRLVPIYDRARISQALRIDHEHFWEATWCTLRDSEIRSRLCDLRSRTDLASGLSLLRILDIVTWMSMETGQ